MTTTTAAYILQTMLDEANPNLLSDALRKVKLGHMLSRVKITVASLTATATPDVTSDSVLAASTVSGITLATGENLPAIGQLISLRVTASGTAGSLGTYVFTDAGGTALVPPGGASAAVGIAEISDDGTTITFPNTVTGFVLEYWPAPYTATSTAVAM